MNESKEGKLMELTASMGSLVRPFRIRTEVNSASIRTGYETSDTAPSASVGAGRRGGSAPTASLHAKAQTSQSVE